MARPRLGNDVQVNFRVPDDFNPRAKLAAALAGVSVSEFMRRAIARSLAEALTDRGTEQPSKDKR